MKTTLHSFLILCGLLWIVQSGHCQESGKPLLVQENRSWNTRISSPVMPDYHTERTRITFLHGDTLVGETAYTKAYRSYYKDKSQAEYAGCLRQEGDQVFVIGKDKDQEVLLYDFGLEQGDTFTFDSSFDKMNFTFSATVASTDSVTIGEMRHKRILFDEGQHGVWIEGIGSTDDILTHYSWMLAGSSGYSLLCCYDENGEKLYQSDLTEKTFLQKPQDNMIGEGTKWTDKYFSNLTRRGGETSYYIEGDTLVNSELYWKVNLEGWGNYNPFVLMREDRDSTIYIRFLYGREDFFQIESNTMPFQMEIPETHKDCLLYSFGNWKIGVTFPYITSGRPETEEITSIGSTQLADGIIYKTINGYIQTVGSERGILDPYVLHPANGSSFYLYEYYRKGIPLYRNTSISKIKNELHVSCPAKGTIVFHTENLAGNGKITLTDLSGKAVRNVQKIESAETIVNNLPPGIYLYEFGGNNELKGKVAVW